MPTVVIPLSLVGAFALMAAMGFSINTLTLLAMVLAIGMVVDDVIVVVENIHRHIAMGKPPLESALAGAKEIQSPVIVMTLTLAAVYAPIGFASGLGGALFKEFAFSLASAVFLSGVVALTLTPMLASKIMKAHRKGATLSFEGGVNRFFSSLERGYSQLLSILLKGKWLLILLIPVLIYGSGYLFMRSPQELGPAEDTGAILTFIKGPPAANLDYTEKQTQALADVYHSLSETFAYALINGYPNGESSGLSYLVLKPWKQRNRSVSEIIQAMTPKLWAIPGARIFPINPYQLPGLNGLFPVELAVTTATGTYMDLYKAVHKLMKAAESIPFLANIDTNLNFNKPEIIIDIDRRKAADLGISVEEIAQNINIALGEPLSTQFERNGRSYYVIPQLDRSYQATTDSLKNIYLRTASGKLTPLSNIAHFKERAVNGELTRFQQLRSATITALVVPPGFPIGVPILALKDLAQKVLPKGISFDFSGISRQFLSSQGEFLEIFLYAIILFT